MSDRDGDVVRTMERRLCERRAHREPRPCVSCSLDTRTLYDAAVDAGMMPPHEVDRVLGGVEKLLRESERRWKAQARRLGDAIREHHRPSPADGRCISCATEQDEPGRVDEFLEWPCPTAAALEDDEEDSDDGG